jgi:hypothetical protein
MARKYKRYKQHKINGGGVKKCFFLALGLICVLLPLQAARSTNLPETNVNDDSELIVSRIKESLATTGLISVEQNTGRLLFNPVVDRLHNMALKKKFFLPSIVVNQKKGLRLITEIPMSCFMIAGGELSNEYYKGYRQHETMMYIRDIKEFPVSRALICQTVGSTNKHWKRHLALGEESEPFVFEEHVSLSGEHFYYFLNVDGSFEMYM